MTFKTGERRPCVLDIITNTWGPVLDDKNVIGALMCCWDEERWVWTPCLETMPEAAPVPAAPHHVRHLANELVLALLQEFIGESTEDFPLSGGELARLRDTFERTIVETEEQTFPVVYYHPPGTLPKPTREEMEAITQCGKGQVTVLPQEKACEFRLLRIDATRNRNCTWSVDFYRSNYRLRREECGNLTECITVINDFLKHDGAAK